MAETCPAEALEKGGPGSITEQLLDTRPDIALGGGVETFAQAATGGEYAGKTLEVQAKGRGYQIVCTAPELAKIGEANQGKPVLGLFAEGNMLLRWTGPAAMRQCYLTR
jgi:alkaline phosphatase